LPVDTTAAAVRFDLFPCSSQVLRLIYLIHQRVHLLLSVRIEPVSQSPRRTAEGFFLEGTVPCRRLTHWPSCSFPTSSRTAFPGSLIRSQKNHAVYANRASGTSPSSDFSSDLGCPFALSAYRHALIQQFCPAGCPMRSPRVTICSSAPCRPHTPWFEGWMECACHSADSTLPPLWPTGSSLEWLPSIPARSFSASPSDSTSRWTPCPSRCLVSASGPARHYSRFWIWHPPSEHQWDFNPPEHIAA